MTLRRLSLKALLFAPALAMAQSQSPWRAERDGVEVGAAALQRDQIAAFYQARGFSAEAVASYAEACVFSFELRNTGRQTLRLRLADWRAADGKGSARFTPPEEWDAKWAGLGVAQAARIAFRWAQFQSELEFEPGDWIMGMAALERRPDAPFRLIISYSANRRQNEITLDMLACAP